MSWGPAFPSSARIGLPLSVRGSKLALPPHPFPEDRIRRDTGMTTNVELYEVLRDRIGEEAARMIAESVPPARELATREDVEASASALRGEMAGLREDLAAMRGELLAAIKGTEAGLMRWMLTFFGPLWLGVWATLAAIILTR